MADAREEGLLGGGRDKTWGLEQNKRLLKARTTMRKKKGDGARG